MLICSRPSGDSRATSSSAPRSPGPKLFQRCVHVDRVPEDDEVDRQAKRTELVLLTFSVTLAQLAPPAMKDDAGELVTAFSAVKLDQDAATIGLVVDVAQKIERLDQPAEFFKRAGQLGRAVLGLQRADQPGGLHGAELERPGQAQQVFPVLDDERDIGGFMRLSSVG